MLDGQLDNAQEIRLHAIISTDAAAQREYLDQCHVHAMLRRELENPWTNVTRRSPAAAAGWSAPASIAGRIARFFVANALAVGGLLAFAGLFSLAASILLYAAAVKVRAENQWASNRNQQDFVRK